ncbi:MAG: phospholipase D family protein [Gilliamella sp.]|uniref:phospholipase D family protein n=1 Tax=Gilliamella sp. TaxID=1891236 RepID=UPI0025EFCD0C|nr:phospholipase D family protein [Gilliamella sp.]MCO6538469.1 phospholipase D family protein [Gilliamella sp.]
MKIITKPTYIDNKLVELMGKYTNYYIATAWASMNSHAASKLLDNKKHIAKMVVGTHFYQTHPDFIKIFASHRNVKFILKTDKIFHPKVYLFSDENSNWECLIGSANFTQAALTKNDEIMIHITSNDQGSEKIFTDILKTIDNYWEYAEEMTEKEINKYTNIWKKNKTKLDSLKNVYGGYKSKKSMIKSNILSLQWNEYYEKIREKTDEKDESSSFSKRIKVLQEINNYFKEKQIFSSFTKLQRKQVAGLIDDGSEIEWKWFGSMVGAGVFHSKINNNDPNISNALNCIPLTGPVNEANYNQFIKIFKQAFPAGKCGIGIASRLLAMKRPDYFVCLDGQNRPALCKDFGIPQKIDLETYWEQIIARIIDSVWWSSSCPDDSRKKEEKQAWNGRVAMIDAIFYQLKE